MSDLNLHYEKLLEKRDDLRRQLKLVNEEINIFSKSMSDRDVAQLAAAIGVNLNLKNTAKYTALNRFMKIFHEVPDGKSIHKSTVYDKYRQMAPEGSDSSMRGYFRRFINEGHFQPVKRGSYHYRLSNELKSLQNVKE